MEIKFKDKDIKKTIHRIDPVILKLKSELSNADLSAEEKTRLESSISEREQVLKPMFHQVAVHFADLHDTPQRMLEKGVIAVRILFNRLIKYVDKRKNPANQSTSEFLQQGIVSWPESRRIFYWRLRRLVLQNQVKQQLLNVQPNLAEGQVISMLRRWFAEDKGTTQVRSKF